MKARCQPGDLAVVISAVNPSNLGRIVKVIAVHDRTGDLVIHSDSDTVWLIESDQLMTWSIGAAEFLHRRRGPVPDSQLQPIRDLSVKRKKHKQVTLEPA